MNELSSRGLNRDTIKYLAIITMTISHVGIVFLDPFGLLAEICHCIGQFTAITMCYFLVEGYAHTHSKVKYALRLLLFALISQLPYWYALKLFQLNMLFTLLLCFLILVVMDKLKIPLIDWLVILFLVWLSKLCDWGILAPIFTILFAKLQSSKPKRILAYALSFLILFLDDTSLYMAYYDYIMPRAALFAFFSGIGLLVSGIVIVWFYNGQKATWGAKINKWFFYLFYPGHLVLLWLLKIILGMTGA